MAAARFGTNGLADHVVQSQPAGSLDFLVLQALGLFVEGGLKIKLKSLICFQVGKNM